MICKNETNYFTKQELESCKSVVEGINELLINQTEEDLDASRIIGNKIFPVEEDENYSSKYISYEHIWIIISVTLGFIFFGVYITHRTKKKISHVKVKNVHEKFEPLDPEKGAVTVEPPLPCVENSVDEIVVVEKCVNNKNVEIPYNQVEQTTWTNETSSCELKNDPEQIDMPNEISSIEDKNEPVAELNDSEEQMRRKTTRTVTFDESLNQTRQISCVGIAPDNESVVQPTEVIVHVEEEASKSGEVQDDINL